MVDKVGKFEIVPHEEYPGQFRVKYPDGVLSKDFYNYTRAREHASILSTSKEYRNKKVHPK